MSPRTREVARWALAGLGYALVAAAFFAPLGSHLVDEQIGSGDSLESLWNAWWVGQSLLRLENPWFTHLLFAPEGTPLVWHSLAPLSAAAVSLLAAILPVPAAYNAVAIAALPAAGLSAWALCRHATGDAVASFVGGLAFMLSPFLTSKTLGHLDLLYGGLLPLFYVALLRAVEDVRPARTWQLAGACLLLLFTCNPSIPVFAANLAFFLLCREVRREGAARARGRFARVFGPTLAVSLPYLVLVVVYATAFGYPPRSHADLAYDPELVSYLLPLTKTSLWSDGPNGLGLVVGAGFGLGLDEVEPAVYLGICVLPLAVAGGWLRRRDPLVGHLALVGAVFLVFSLGPKLQWHREIVELGGATVYLPFGLWRWVPVLGAVGQAARYALVVYLVIGVGVACAVAALRARLGARARLAVTAAAALVVAADYGFAPVTSSLPVALELARFEPDRARVLDPRLSSPETMYQQTLHGRPLVGGYVSRTPPGPLAGYVADPVLGWFFRRDPGPAPDRDALRTRLEALEIGDVLLAPGDPRGAVLQRYGFTRRDANRYTVVWTP